MRIRNRSRHLLFVFFFEGGGGGRAQTPLLLKNKKLYFILPRSTHLDLNTLFWKVQVNVDSSIYVRSRLD